MPLIPCQPASAMYVYPMSSLKISLTRIALLSCTLCVGFMPAHSLAQADKAPAAGEKEKPADKGAPDKSALPPLPPEAHVQQTIQLDGKPLKYTVTVGALPVRDGDGKVAGDVVVTAYTVEGQNRPVTFAF